MTVGDNATFAETSFTVNDIGLVDNTLDIKIYSAVEGTLTTGALVADTLIDSVVVELTRDPSVDKDSWTSDNVLGS